MFTGLVETVGTIKSSVPSGGGLRLQLKVTWPDSDQPRKGDSVAVNGVCLTAVDDNPLLFTADLSAETRKLSLFESMQPGDPVNLERALTLQSRLGGHLVQGHVDAVVRLLGIETQQNFARWRISMPPENKLEIAKKGSVTLHGVSLTVADLADDSFEIALIPETLSVTCLGTMRPGSRMHLETDVLAKYVARQLGSSQPTTIQQVFGGR